MKDHHATVVGSGPNGLAAAIRLAEAGYSVHLIEGSDQIGGGTRTRELTLPGYLHDVCAAVHPLAIASPFFRSLGQEVLDIDWIQSPVVVAHPLENGKAVAVYRSLDTTADQLGRDGHAYKKLIEPLLAKGYDLFADLMGPLHWPKYLPEFMRVGLAGAIPTSIFNRLVFKTPEARALLAGMAAHSQQPLGRPVTAAFGLMMLYLAHLSGWPVIKGGTQKISESLVEYFCSLGGQITISHEVKSLKKIPTGELIFLDVTPRQALALAGDRFSNRYKRQLERYRYGMGIYKMDFALDGPIPWMAEACTQAASIHLGGKFEEIVDSERTCWRGGHSEKPYIILSQPSLFDPTRAPAGGHTVWAYCHVPNGSTKDMSGAIESQIERYAPGFQKKILAKSMMNTADLQLYNPNYIGGDINGGVQDMFQFFTRPVLSFDPYKTSDPNIYLCSSSTPPGGGVHGLCGEFAVRSALNNLKDE